MVAGITRLLYAGVFFIAKGTLELLCASIGSALELNRSSSVRAAPQQSPMVAGVAQGSVHAFLT
jgi:hypothetical protein